MEVKLLLLPRSENLLLPLRLKPTVQLTMIWLLCVSLFSFSGVARAEAVGSDLPRFGYDFFDTARLAPPASAGPVDSTYVIGPQDEFVIHISGAVSEEHAVTVDHEGRIVLPKAGVVHIWGL